MSVIHKAAQLGFSTQAGAYSQGRPDYPDELGTWLQHTLGIDAQSSVVDLGAGTGKFTRLLTPLTAHLTAVEPVEPMRQEFAKRFPDTPIVCGTAESLPLEDATADVLVCAQAFHWFANDAAVAEIHRVLKPGGRLGLIWNVRDESVDWVAQITRIITPYEGDTPRFHTGDWRLPFDGRYFAQPELTCLNYTHSGDAETVIMNRFLSVSFIAALPQAEKAVVTKQLRDLIQTHPALRDRQTVEFPYQTQAYLCRRLD
ncbi:class I SAM-dependent methyltransferase [Pseudomonas sp. LP_7_YM]|uniref:class I SAM-dependent methyltransferase n=1 Tax=Pseudomonas sp. LP_7_YM TaxID=2485137 RepID=UPI00105BB065|nr:class I SAM-dependent methyltransferase [Pseudomonas sp. LP_7_YM]TDV72219.1 methyltransferase family protein [Pseudomonas sp. LP_7_YM]